MDVQQALRARRSVRAFLSTPLPAQLVQDLLEQAARAASGGNLQPWRVLALTGEPLAAVVATAARSDGEDGGHYPPSLWEPYRTRRFANAEAMYATVGLAREDKAGRLVHFGRNAAFFGAPVGVLICVDRRMGLPQWTDLGIYLQSLMLLAVQHGLASCPQGFWRRYRSVLAPVLQLPEPYEIACGLALGYEDTDAPINTLRTPRAPWQEWGQLRGWVA
ncbi:MAG: NADH dehydrogenase [Comamonas sp. SCN 65-56]|uniref:nitroreductase n=1 Tax=Comamonas sp. SCN 65-56 TaxID=1660095 RepID=UPI000869637E|nr:nitroreductase [Comamonas sp. SCN 65-56]ODS90902.1 MAG: NADH dehydrogenase [Comamonas sp. SCN 65-56]